MRKLYAALIVLCSACAFGQASASGNITASGTTTSCGLNQNGLSSNGACVTLPLPPSAGAVGVSFTNPGGSFSGTLQFESTAGNGDQWAAQNCYPPNSTTAATSTTSVGNWQCNVAGMNGFRVRASALSAGFASINLQLSTASAKSGGAGVTPGSSCGDSSHALGWTGTAYDCQAITGSAAAGGSNTQLQWNNATALGGITQWTTNGTTTVTGGATGILDVSGLSVANLKFPAAEFQTNGSSNASVAGLNFVTSTTNATGLTLTPSNSTNAEKLEATGTVNATSGGTGQDTHTSTGVAQVSSGTWSVNTALANGTTATTQTVGDNTTKVATDAFVLANAGGGSLPSASYAGDLPSASGAGTTYAAQSKTWVDIRDWYDAGGAGGKTPDIGLAIANAITAFGSGMSMDLTGLCNNQTSGATVIAYGQTNPWHTAPQSAATYFRFGCNIRVITSVTWGTPAAVLRIEGVPSYLTGTSTNGFVLEPCVAAAGCGPNSYPQFPIDLTNPVAGTAVAAGPPAPAPTTYTTGTATFTNASHTVTGSGTTWTAAMVGGWIYSGTGAQSNACVGYINQVVSATSIHIANVPNTALCTIAAGSGVAGTYTIVEPNANVLFWDGSGDLSSTGTYTSNLNNGCYGHQLQNFRIDEEGLPSGIGYYTDSCQEQSFYNGSDVVLNAGHQGSSNQGFDDASSAYLPPLAGVMLDNYYLVPQAGGGAIDAIFTALTINMGVVPAANCANGNSYLFVDQGWGLMNGQTVGAPSYVDFSTTAGKSACTPTDNAYLDGITGGLFAFNHVLRGVNSGIHLGANNPTTTHIANVSGTNFLANIPLVWYDTNASAGNKLDYVATPITNRVLVKDTTNSTVFGGSSTLVTSSGKLAGSYDQTQQAYWLGTANAGIFNAATGFELGGAAPNNHILCGNGTNYVDNTPGGCGISGSGTVNSGTAGNGAYYATSTTAVSDGGAATVTYGILNAATGFRIAGAAANNHILCGNGTNYVDNTPGGCGISGSGTVNSGTANHLAYYASSTTAVSNDSTATDDGTTLTYSGTGGIAASAGPISSTGPSGKAGMVELVGNTANQTIATNQFAWGGFSVANATAYGLQPPNTAPSGGQTMSCPTPTSGWSQCSWVSPGSGTVTVVGAGSLTSTALVTGGGTTTLQTPSATTTLDSSGNLQVAAGGSVSSADTGTPGFTFSTNKIAVNKLLGLTSTTNQIATGTGSNISTLSFPASSGAVTLTFPNTTTNVLGGNSDTTTTHVLHATATGGIGSFSAIATGDLPSAVVFNNAANTGTSAMTLDMSASTTANSFKVPAQAGLTAGADGVIAYDTTGKLTHVRTNGADSSVITETGTSTTTTQVLHATAVAGIGSFSAIASGDLPTQYTKGSCTEVWGGSGTSFAMQSGDDAIANNACYNDSGVTRTITAVKCRGDNASNTTTVNPTFGSAGTGTTILSGALTCGNSYAYSSSGTVSNASWTTGTGIDPGMATVGNATSIAMIVEYTY